MSQKDSAVRAGEVVARGRRLGAKAPGNPFAKIRFNAGGATLLTITPAVSLAVRQRRAVGERRRLRGHGGGPTGVGGVPDRLQGGVGGVDRQALTAEADAVGVGLGQAEIEVLAALAAAVAEAPFNVGGLHGPEDIRRKHLVDSLGCLRTLSPSDGEWVVDLGSGAGFPGLPLAVARPKVRFTLVEATGKKAAFLRGVVGELGLSRVDVVQARAEELGRDPAWRERVDGVVARAVAPLSTLVEWALPLCRVGGRLVALKGPAADAEVAAAGRALAELRGRVTRADRFRLPGGPEERVVLAVLKTGATPVRYPRRAGVASRRPL